jgi:thymidylate kinase
MQGKFIVIEGIDGSGTSTQSQLLFDYLNNQGNNLKHYLFYVAQNYTFEILRLLQQEVRLRCHYVLGF